MKKVFLIALLFVCVTIHAQETYYPQALVELYSSEGCENCPIADQFMKEILHMADSFHQPVYVIDFHVDIWNRSGWVDPFSDSINSRRQFNEAMSVGQLSIFTPMVFVNGQGGIPGAAKKEVGNYINALMRKFRDHNLTTNAQVYQSKNALSIDYKIDGNIDSVEIHFALVKKLISSNVTAGDNKGKTLIHHNVVRMFKSELVKAKSGHYDLPLPDPNIDLTEYGLISFIQKQNGGYIYAIDELLFK
jgi:hypothetical protein